LVQFFLSNLFIYIVYFTLNISILGSYLFGLLAKYIGRIACFIIPSILNYAAILLMIFWKPNADQTFVLFLIPSKKINIIKIFLDKIFE